MGTPIHSPPPLQYVLYILQTFHFIFDISCYFSDQVYYGARALEAHRQAVHGGGVPCRDCGVVLNTPQQLQAHSLVHKKDKFNCNVST